MIFIYLIICFFIIISDLKKRVIPDYLTIPGSLVGILLNIFLPGGIGFAGSIEGLGAGIGSLLISGIICSIISKSPSVGGGDLKFMAMIGAFWGTKTVLLTFAISPFLASLWAMKFLQPRSAYGVFIFVASLIALIFMVNL